MQSLTSLYEVGIDLLHMQLNSTRNIKMADTSDGVADPVRKGGNRAPPHGQQIVLIRIRQMDSLGKCS